MLAELNHVRGFDDSDWHAFAGCEEWAPDKPPVMISDDADRLVIADSNGVTAYIGDDAWILVNGSSVSNIAFPSQYLASVFLQTFPLDFTEDKLFQLGFVSL